MAKKKPAKKSSGEGIDLRDCPLAPGTMQDAWLKGWLFAERSGK